MIKKINLVFFCPNLGGGGAEMHLARLLSNLDQGKFELHLIVSRAGGSYLSLLPEQVQIHIICDGKIGSGILGMYKTIKPLSEKLTFLNPDIFVSVMDHSNMMAYYAHKKARSSAKLIFCVQTPILQSLKFNWKPFNQILSWMMPFIYPRADKIISLSIGVKSDLISLSRKLKDNTVVINNIGIDQFKKVEDDPVQKEGVKSIVICGRLIKLKGFDDALRCFKKVSEVIAAELYVIGDGPEKQNLLELSEQLNIKDKVQWLGFVSHPEVIMSHADAFLLCSHYEGFGNVIIEAMSVGLPVVSTDCPYGPGEIIDDNISGVLVPVGDFQRMAKEVVKILSDRKLSEKLIQNAYERVGDFSKERITQQYERLFEKLV